MRSVYDCPTSDILPVRTVGMCFIPHGLFSSIIHRRPCHGAPYNVRRIAVVRIDPRWITSNLAAAVCLQSVNLCAARWSVAVQVWCDCVVGM